MYTVNYGVTDALAPFPLHQLVNTMTATINNNSISVNMQDVLPAILRMADPDELALYASTTPTALDYLANYRDGIDVLEYQISAVGIGGSVGTVGTTIRPAFCLYRVRALIPLRQEQEGRRQMLILFKVMQVKNSFHILTMFYHMTNKDQPQVIVSERQGVLLLLKESLQSLIMLQEQLLQTVKSHK